MGWREWISNTIKWIDYCDRLPKGDWWRQLRSRVSCPPIPLILIPCFSFLSLQLYLRICLASSMKLYLQYNCFALLWSWHTFELYAMDNTQKRQCQWHGITRPSPTGQIADAILEEEDHWVRAERSRVCQASYRSRVVAVLVVTQCLCSETEDGAANFMTVRDINRVSLTLATFVASELVGCLGPQSYLVVMK